MTLHTMLGMMYITKGSNFVRFSLFPDPSTVEPGQAPIGHPWRAASFAAGSQPYLALAQSIGAHQSGEAGVFFEPKLTDLYRNPGMST